MTVSSPELTALANEISHRAGGRKIGKIHQTDTDDITLILGSNRQENLFISVHPSLGRIYLTSSKSAVPRSPTAFAQLLRKHLSGEKLEEISKLPNDRMVRISFIPSECSLYCRFHGGGGFLLTDADNKILGIHNFLQKPALKTGQVYIAPKPPLSGEELAADFKGSPSEIIENRYASLLETSLFENMKNRGLSKTVSELKKCRKLQKALSRDREKLESFKNYSEWGDLCTTYFKQIKKGSPKVTLKNPATGEDVTVKLDPKLSVPDNIKNLYGKHKKYLSGIVKIGSALSKAMENEKILEKKIETLNNAKTEKEIIDCLGKQLAKSKTGKSLTREKNKKSPWRVFTSADGYEIQVGRNDKQNDALVRKSNGNDIWLHTRDFPGSHVVVRAGGKKDLPHSTILEAARYALKFSSLAKSMKGVVIYTYIKHVKRPKKAPPGKVLVTHEKTIQVRLS